MSNALLFPGQGSQSIGMGLELYESVPEAKALLDMACDVVGYDMKKVMFEGSIEQLTDTAYAQPAIYTCSAMYLEKAKKENSAYDYVAGHSLGEYDALYAAGVFSFADGLRLVNQRGKAMAKENGKGRMAAILGLTEEQLKPVIDAVPDVVMANLNTKTQIVVSGTADGINTVMDKLGAYADVQVRELAVSAAFHSPQMAEAAAVMEKEIDQMEMRQPTCFVVPNVTGEATKDLETIRTNLKAQMTGQVRWYSSIMAMKAAGVDAFYECGNGDVLRKMNKAITLKPKCFSV